VILPGGMSDGAFSYIGVCLMLLDLNTVGQ
jgi:hypothetical protein